MKRFWLFTRSLALIHIRNRTVLFWNLAFPVLTLILYGVIFRGDTFASAGAGFNYIDWVLPGVLVFNALAFGLITSSSMMLSMRELGVLRRLQATPMPSSQLVASYLLVNVTIVLLQSLIIISAAVLLFGATVTAPGLLLAIPMILVGVITFVAMGQVVSGLSPTAGTAVIVGQLLYFLLLFVTDLIFPLQSLPEWLQKAAVYLPSYAVVRMIRPPLMGNGVDPQLGLHLGIAAAYTLAAAFIAARLFRWEPRA
jgi:ABC-2 type transport system permease protein